VAVSNGAAENQDDVGDDHLERARSFGPAAAEYARYRPGYPRAAVEWALQPVLGGQRVRLLDLGAGTGKLTAALMEFGPVIAVEPDPGMLGELRVRYPAADARAGSAEEIPVPDSSVDAILVGQAWHWFDHAKALAEAARVLRSGGVLAALWNTEDTSAEWVRGYLEATNRTRRTPSAQPTDGIPMLPTHPAFTGSSYRQHPNPTPTTAEALVGSVATQSWILIADDAARDTALGRLRDYLAGRPETSSGEFELPLVTDVIRVLRK
jgi:SAM-dependent methyltransferase